jgi:hypothetical protein
MPWSNRFDGRRLGVERPRVAPSKSHPTAKIRLQTTEPSLRSWESQSESRNVVEPEGSSPCSQHSTTVYYSDFSLARPLLTQFCSILFNIVLPSTPSIAGALFPSWLKFFRIYSSPCVLRVASDMVDTYDILTWNSRQDAAPKRRYLSTRLHGVTSQDIVILYVCNSVIISDSNKESGVYIEWCAVNDCQTWIELCAVNDCQT